MLEAYSLNVSVGENAAIPFNSASLSKGCTTSHPAPDTIYLNRRGVYMVSVDGTASLDTTIQLYKDGVAQSQAQNTGTSVSFVSLVQCDHDNSCCCDTSPTTIQVFTTEAVDFDNVNICVTKVC